MSIIDDELLHSVYEIIYSLNNKSDKFVYLFLTFIKSYQKYFQEQIKLFFDPTSIGFVSPRLLRDPLSIDFENDSFNFEEKKSFVSEYVKGILLLIYCLRFNVEGWELKNSDFYIENYNFIQSKETNDLLTLFTELKKTLDTSTIKEKNFRSNEDENYPKFTFSQGTQQNNDNNPTDVLFTARLTAHYRSEELKNEKPLIIDKFANELAGNLEDYDSSHSYSTKRNDYGIIRTYYIDQIIEKWTKSFFYSQIVFLGAGLDARAYRLEYLKNNSHKIFELDMKELIQYKETILKKYSSFCEVIRLPTDLADTNWFDNLLKSNFSKTLPTLWILEGLVYYLEKDQVKTLLKDLDFLSLQGSILFLDVCVPAFAEVNFGPFMKHFKWGINKNDVSELFMNTSWQITSSFADDHDNGRDVGQRGMIFIEGFKN